MAGAVIFANSLAAFAGSETAETVVIAPRLGATARRASFFAVVVAFVPRTPRVAATVGVERPVTAVIVVIARIAMSVVVVLIVGVGVPFTAPRRCVSAIDGLAPKLASVNRPNPNALATRAAIAAVPRRRLPMCDAIVVVVVVLIVSIVVGGVVQWREVRRVTDTSRVNRGGPNSITLFAHICYDQRFGSG